VVWWYFGDLVVGTDDKSDVGDLGISENADWESAYLSYNQEALTRGQRLHEANLVIGDFER
jgi:hypothetical protein